MLFDSLADWGRVIAVVCGGWIQGCIWRDLDSLQCFASLIVLNSFGRRMHTKSAVTTVLSWWDIVHCELMEITVAIHCATLWSRRRWILIHCMVYNCTCCYYMFVTWFLMSYTVAMCFRSKAPLRITNPCSLMITFSSSQLMTARVKSVLRSALTQMRVVCENLGTVALFPLSQFYGRRV